MRTYDEADIAAEEERFGGRLPDELRTRFKDGMPDTVILRTQDGDVAAFETWAPSATTSDKKGREYPTPGMTKETQEVRGMADDLLGDDVLVAWGADGSGDLAVVLKDGTLGWWMHDGDGEVVPVEVDWEPDADELAEL